MDINQILLTGTGYLHTALVAVRTAISGLIGPLGLLILFLTISLVLGFILCKGFVTHPLSFPAYFPRFIIISLIIFLILGYF
jgi:hypothetical protein